MLHLSRRLRRFQKEEDGVIMSEFLILLPLLIWAFVALFVYWDAFRTINESQKASYAVADLLSRQRSNMATSYVNGMDDVAEMMMSGSPNVKVRVTSIEWDPDNDRHWVLFSRSPGNEMPQLTTAGMRALRSKIPVMANHDSVLVIETEVDYRPAFDVGLTNKVFKHFVVTRPRTLRRICLADSMSTCPETM